MMMQAEAKPTKLPFDLPDGWSEERLDALADINPELLGEGTPASFEFRYIDISSVEQGVIDWAGVTAQTFADAPSRARRVVRPKDALLCTVRPALQAHTFADWQDEDGFICSTGFAVIRAKDQNEPRYLYHLIFSDYIAAQIRRLEIGSSYPAINENDVKSLIIAAAPPPEQHRIAEVLDAVDAAIQRTDTLINKLKWMKAGLLNDLLTRGLDRDGKLRDPIRHPEQFKDEPPFGLIPNGWDYKPLKNVTLKVADRDHTTPIYVDEGIPMVSPLNFFGDEGIDFASCKRITPIAHSINQKKTDIQCDDVIIHRIGAGLGRVRLVTPEMPDFSILHSLAMIRPDINKVAPLYLLWALRDHGTQRQMQLGTQSIGVPDLGLDKIEQLLLPVPRCKDEQQQIANTLNSHQNMIHAEEAKRNKLIQIKKGLMHDLLTGRLRVPAKKSEVVAV
jgi:type I restriction enzyme, S subunit